MWYALPRHRLTRQSERREQPHLAEYWRDPWQKSPAISKVRLGNEGKFQPQSLSGSNMELSISRVKGGSSDSGRDRSTSLWLHTHLRSCRPAFASRARLRTPNTSSSKLKKGKKVEGVPQCLGDKFFIHVPQSVAVWRRAKSHKRGRNHHRWI